MKAPDGKRRSGPPGRRSAASGEPVTVAAFRRLQERLSASEEQLQTEVANAQLLQEISAALVNEENVEALYDRIMDAAVAIMRSDFASMQMLVPERGQGGELRLLGHRGFSPEAVLHWQWVGAADACACGEALRTRSRIVVDDVLTCAFVADAHADSYRQAGIRAVQSTPLLARDGHVVGMISTHWAQPYQPSARDLRLLDILARQAADLIERIQTRQALQAAARRDSYLVRLADALRPLASPTEIQAEAARLLGEHLDVERVASFEVVGAHYVVECDYARGVPSLRGRYAVDWFGPKLLAAYGEGRTVVVADVAADPDLTPAQRKAFDALQIGAYIGMPLMRDGVFVAGLAVHSAQPYDWSADDVAVTQKTAEHTWAAVERVRAEQALRDADRRKDEFLATLAHELRNPLAPVRNALHVLHLLGNDVPKLEWAREVIERQVVQMTRLVDDLLDASRISRGILQLRRERLELAGVVESAVETCRPLVEQGGHELTVAMPPQPVVVDGDGTRLAQVLCNLLNNAARYSERGGRITVTVRALAKQAVITVRDNGIGIPPDMLTRVFEPFTQVDRSLEKSQGGLGIGLTLVKQLVELHGGRVQARSPGPGQGSEFEVRLPLAQAETRTPVEPGQPSAPETATSRRVLIVDDYPDAAEALGTMVGLVGHEVRTAFDGLEAVRVAGEFQPHVVLLDIGLPGLNGYDAARAIRAEPWGHGMVLVAVTGWGQDQDRRRSADAGFDRHLVKPVEPESLLELLASLEARPAASPVGPLEIAS